MTVTVTAADLKIDALVLAGRRDGEIDPLAGVENVPHKALLVAGGKPLILRVIEALKSSGRIDRIAIDRDRRQTHPAQARDGRVELHAVDRTARCVGDRRRRVDPERTARVGQPERRRVGRL